MDAAVEHDRSRPILPRFSIRALLGMLTVCAVAFLIAGMAFRGQFWAWGVTIALASLVLTALVHAALFGLVWLFAQKVYARPKDLE